MNKQKEIYHQFYPEDDWNFKWMGFADIYDRIRMKKNFPKKKQILYFIKTFQGKTLSDLADDLNVYIVNPDNYFGKKRARYHYLKI